MAQEFLERLFPVFRIPAYRWMWGSSFLSSSGFISFTLVQGWLILDISGSPLMVGLAPALSGIASLAVSPWGGVLADRLDRRRVLIFCQLLSASILLCLGLLAITGLIQVWHILLLAPFQGINMGLQWPVRGSLMYDLVGRRAVMNAMAGQFLAFHGASVIGSFAAGFLLEAFGPGPVFLGVSGLMFLAAALLTRLPHTPRTPARAVSLWQDFQEGLGFALHDRPVRAVLGVILVTETLGFSSRAMLPVVARDLLHAGPSVLGLLSTLWAVGGVTATLGLSSIGHIRARGWVFIVAASGFGVLLLLFSFSRSLPLSLALLFLAGSFGAIYDTMDNTLLQTLSPDAMRGRVMGLYGVLTSGFSLGALLMGALASAFGVTTAIAAGGGAVSANALRAIPAARLIGERSAAEPEAAPPAT
ncbi:MAG: MFS transporter [Chloroflexi bacterium]|nr:MFS transporter [Chloroflexota bacterium]